MKKDFNLTHVLFGGRGVHTFRYQNLSLDNEHNAYCMYRVIRDPGNSPQIIEISRLARLMKHEVFVWEAHGPRTTWCEGERTSYY